MVAVDELYRYRYNAEAGHLPGQLACRGALFSGWPRRETGFQLDRIQQGLEPERRDNEATLQKRLGCDRGTRADAANMKARATLMLAVRKAIDVWDLTQVTAAKRLGISQPRLNDLLNGRIDKFSLDALVNLAAQAGLAVTIGTARKAA